MTKDEIEKLKALEREAQKGLGKNGMVYESFEAAARWQARDYHAGVALPRLLEERERLLEALRQSRECSSDRLRDGRKATEYPAPAEVFAGALMFVNEVATAAIAFAEAPAAPAPAGKEEK